MFITFKFKLLIMLLLHELYVQKDFNKNANVKATASVITIKTVKGPFVVKTSVHV